MNPTRTEFIDIGRGRTVEIRPTTPEGAAGLAELYAGFTADDLHRRFFSAFVPTEEWCASWASVAERGGFGLIAVVHADDGDAVIGEAGYALQENGDGELAVAVASAWRGWVGIYLVDRLVRHAAQAGIANLQAEILLANRAMIGIMRHRGAIDLEHPDGVVRLSIATTGDVASWPSADDNRKILIASSSGRWSGEHEAHVAGWSTAVCKGPVRRGGGGCPVLRGERCPLADGADAIVVMLDPDEPTTGELIDALRSQRPSAPVLAVRSRRADPEAGGDDQCVELGATGPETFARIVSMVGADPDSTSARASPPAAVSDRNGSEDPGVGDTETSG